MAMTSKENWNLAGNHYKGSRIQKVDMSRIPQLLQRSFLEQFGRITRSATSLRARIRDGAKRPATEQSSAAASEIFVPTRVTRAPDGECIYAIGDIHGRCDLLDRLMVEIEADAASLPAGTKATIVFLGDYIDRGLQSKDVIEMFLGDRLAGFNTIYLMGNHEEALLKFLDDASFGSQWARYGGAETLYSYGFQAPNSRSTLGSHDAMANAKQAWEELWNEFRVRLPEPHLDFYRSLRPYHVAGDYLFVHAGLRPERSLREQSVRDMLWIRDEFLDDDRQFSHLIVHGHTPAEGVFRDDRRLGLDTGAFLSGRLSAAKLFGTEITILAT
ncbi:metallophosphoesterase family protein [Hyphomonas johnsonii]|uniref:metallophosphoesterase family protein n=1 Tax=Hyphomonas johnsonii TaxID=81031 RepID=UPI0019D6ECE5|nr:metallophosphoesterase family protein [Hyphomonas johnsonii]